MAASVPSGGAVDLEKELSCSICTDVLYQPLTLLDCLHTFCGSCLKEWFSWQATSATQSARAVSPYTCPSCRALVRAARPNANVTTLLEMFLVANPGKGKSEQEKTEMRRHYHPGEDIMPPVEVHPESEDSEDERLLRQAQAVSLTEMSAANRRDARDTAHRPERSARRREAADARRRQEAVRRDLTHQSSIRSLLSAGDETAEVQEEIMNTILSSGMLNNIEIDNLTPEQEEELITQLADAYRRQHRPRRRSRDPAAAADTQPRARQTNLSEQWGQDAASNARRPISSDGRSRERAAVVAIPAAVRSTTDPDPTTTQVNSATRSRDVTARRNTDEVVTTSPAEHRLPRRADTSQPQPQTPPAVTPIAAELGMGRLPPQQTPPYPIHDIHSRVRTSPRLPNAAPVLDCYRCGRHGIEYDLHYHCDKCQGGQLNICLQCYRQGRGCKNWFGFGYASASRFQRNAPSGGWPANTERPHTLQARRYVKDTTRLQEGAFCERCHKFADDRYWHCNSCMEGAWGFCSECIDRDRHCTHPLTPVARTPNDDRTRTLRGDDLLFITLPHLRAEGYYYKLPSITCAITGYVLNAKEDWLHCSQCHNGRYDMSFEAYRSLMTAGKISAANGLNGLRKCLEGHPMSIITYHDLTDHIKQRTVLAESIGGYDAKHDAQASSPGNVSRLTCLALWSWWPAADVSDELAFPRYAEIREVEQTNVDYYYGVYAGSRGLFPSNHVRLL